VLPLYGKVWPNDSLRELVKRELQTLREAMAHGEVPFDQIVDACGVQRSPAHNPLVQALITTEEEGEPEGRLCSHCLSLGDSSAADWHVSTKFIPPTRTS
jgi:non-ribosomal peptide synthetase component F